MKIGRLKIAKLTDSLYGYKMQNVDDEAIYCEIRYQRDRSSFAGIAFEITNEKGVITVKECEERMVQDISKYEKLYMGCEQDYIDSVKDIFSLEKKEYGIKILFLLYSDVCSSRIIFEDLIKSVDKNIDKIRQVVADAGNRGNLDSKNG